MNSRRLNTDPWFTPVLTSNSLLKELFTRVLLLAPTWMACTTLTNHYGTPATRGSQHSTFRGTQSKAFSKSTNANIQFPVFCEILLMKLSKNENCICCTSTGAEAKLHFINVNCFTYDVFGHSFSNLKNMII